MRIAIIANVPVWIIPGLEGLKHHRHYATWLESLIPAFQPHAEKMELHWITMCKETPKPIEATAFGQTFHILPRGKLSVEMLSGYVNETLKIRKVIHKLNPDIVHAWGSEDVCGIAGAFSGVKNRIFTLQGSFTEYVRLLGGTPLFRLQAFYEKPTVKMYQHGTAESPGAAKLLKELNPRLEVEIIDYGVSLDFFKATWNPSPNPEVIFVGGVSERKGIADLIEAARRPELKHIKFKIAGEGPMREALEPNAPDNIVWLGRCDRQTVIQEMATAWSLVIPTYADTGPTVVKEARVIGLPVITTEQAGASSYINSTGAGRVIQAGDVAAIASSILEICSSRETCLHFGKQKWEEHRELLSPNLTASRFSAKYRSMCER